MYWGCNFLPSPLSFTKDKPDQSVAAVQTGRMKLPLELVTMEQANDFALRTKQAAVPMKVK